MTTYSFDVVLASLDSITDELADALFAAGSADCEYASEFVLHRVRGA